MRSRCCCAFRFSHKPGGMREAGAGFIAAMLFFGITRCVPDTSPTVTRSVLSSRTMPSSEVPFVSSMTLALAISYFSSDQGDLAQGLAPAYDLQAMARLVISQERLDSWAAEERISVEGDVMTLSGDGRAFRLAPAVRFMKVAPPLLER